MENRLEKLFTHWMLLAINIGVIILVELTGTFFADTGLIHLVAILFIILGASRIFFHHDVYDQYLKPLIHTGIFALIIFAVSHILEFSSHMFLNLPYDMISTNVINLYLASLLMVTLGVESFLNRLNKSPRILIPAAVLGIATCILALGSSFIPSRTISLNPNQPLMYIYISAIILTSLVAILRLRQIKRHVPIMSNFIDYFVAGVILIGISSFQYVTYDVFVSLGMPLFRIVYTSHFLFYGALSLMFLAYVRLTHLGGVYSDLEKLSEAKPTAKPL